MKERDEVIGILETKFFGNLWEKYGKCRVYFDGATIASLYGMEWSKYKTGNISYAELDGERISNSEARRILQAFQWFKIWFDLEDFQFHLKPVGHYTEISYEPSRTMYLNFVADALAAIQEGQNA
jgi:hypothetical protein